MMGYEQDLGKSYGNDGKNRVLRRRSSGGAKALYGTGTAGNQRSASPRSDLHDLRTIYEGPVGAHAEYMCHHTTLIVTNKTVEFEREGANCILSFLTLGLWWFFFQTATIEIYELERVSALLLRDNVIACEMRSAKRGRRCCGTRNARFEIALPANSSAMTTEELFFELKEQWQIIRHGVHSRESADPFV